MQLNAWVLPAVVPSWPLTRLALALNDEYVATGEYLWRAHYYFTRGYMEKFSLSLKCVFCLLKQRLKKWALRLFFSLAFDLISLSPIVCVCVCAICMLGSCLCLSCVVVHTVQYFPSPHSASECYMTASNLLNRETVQSNPHTWQHEQMYVHTQNTHSVSHTHTVCKQAHLSIQVLLLTATFNSLDFSIFFH